jgi:hypothetical protein
MSERTEFVSFVPAIFSNRFSVSVSPTITRITFSDQASVEEKPHTGIVMATADALSLAKLIQTLSDENRKQHPELYRTVGTSQ